MNSHSVSDRPDPPRSLFRYRSLAGENRGFLRDLIVQRELWFSAPSDFNDPFDCVPVLELKGTRLQIDGYFRSLIKGQSGSGSRVSKKVHALALSVSVNLT